MCSRQQHSDAASAAAPAGAAVKFRVEDMTCAHCAGAIETAIEGRVPGASVTADPASKLVSVRGSADVAAIRTAIVAAGYTPSPDPVR